MKSKNVMAIQEELRLLKSRNHTDQELSEKYLELFLQRRTDGLSEAQQRNVDNTINALTVDNGNLKLVNASAAVLEAIINQQDVIAEFDVKSPQVQLAIAQRDVELLNEDLLYGSDDSQKKLQLKTYIARRNYWNQVLVDGGFKSEIPDQPEPSVDLYFQQARELGYDRRDEIYGMGLKWASKSARLRFLELEVEIAQMDEESGEYGTQSNLKMWDCLKEQSEIRLQQTESFLKMEGGNNQELQLIQKTETLRIEYADLMAKHYSQEDRGDSYPIAGTKLYNQIQILRVERWNCLAGNEGELSADRQEILELEYEKLEFEMKSLECQEFIERENENPSPDQQMINKTEIERCFNDLNAEKLKKTQYLRLLEQEEQDNVQAIENVNLELIMSTAKIVLAKAFSETKDESLQEYFVVNLQRVFENDDYLDSYRVVGSSRDEGLEQARKNCYSVVGYANAMMSKNSEIEECKNNFGYTDAERNCNNSYLDLLTIQKQIIAAKYNGEDKLVTQLTAASKVMKFEHKYLQTLATIESIDQGLEYGLDYQSERQKLNYLQAREQLSEVKNESQLRLIENKISQLENNRNISQVENKLIEGSDKPSNLSQEQNELLGLELEGLKAKSRLLLIQENLLSKEKPTDAEKLQEFLAKAEVETFAAQQKVKVSSLEIGYLEDNFTSEDGLEDIRFRIENMNGERRDILFGNNLEEEQRRNTTLEELGKQTNDLGKILEVNRN